MHELNTCESGAISIVCVNGRMRVWVCVCHCMHASLWLMENKSEFYYKEQKLRSVWLVCIWFMLTGVRRQHLYAATQQHRLLWNSNVMTTKLVLDDKMCFYNCHFPVLPFIFNRSAVHGALTPHRSMQYLENAKYRWVVIASSLEHSPILSAQCVRILHAISS